MDKLNVKVSHEKNIEIQINQHNDRVEEFLKTNADEIGLEQKIQIRIAQLARRKAMASLKWITYDELSLDYLNLANAYFDFANYQRALQIIEQIGKDKPEAEWKALKGNIFMKQRRYSEAIQQYYKSLGSVHDFIDKVYKIQIQGLLTICLCKIHKIAEALEICNDRKKAIEQSFGKESMLYGYVMIDEAKIYKLVCDYGNAYDLHSEGLNILIKNKERLENVVRLALEKAEFARSMRYLEAEREALEMVIKILPESQTQLKEQVLLQLAKCLLEQQETQNALKTVLQISDSNRYPINAEISEFLSKIYSKLGRTQESLEYLKNSIKLHEHYGQYEVANRLKSQ